MFILLLFGRRRVCFLLFGRRRVFFLLFGRGAFFVFAVWAGDRGSLTYRSAWLVFKRPNKKKTKQQKKEHGFPTLIMKNPPFCIMVLYWECLLLRVGNLDIELGIKLQGLLLQAWVLGACI